MLQLTSIKKQRVLIGCSTKSGLAFFTFLLYGFSLQVLSQDDTPLLYSLVFGEGVVNDATSVVLFRAVQKLTFDDFTGLEVLQMTGSFLYLFFSSTVLGIMVSLLLQLLWMLFVQTDLPI
jgi:NhaP-type Na+/H+ or K+/H+ antiporter